MINNRRRILLLTAIMGIIALLVGGTTLSLLYNASFDEHKNQLNSLVTNKVLFLQALESHQVNPLFEKLSSINLAQPALQTQSLSSFEYTLARKENNRIHYMLPVLSTDTQQPLVISLNASSELAMQRALNQQSGTLIGLDYRGNQVLAAYQFIPSLQLGIVAKIDISELRQPFIHGALLTCLITLLLVTAGVGLFYHLGNPMIASMNEQESRLKSVLDNTVDAIITIDHKGIIESFNATAERMFGYAATQAIGQNIKLLMPDGYAREHDGYINNYVTSGQKKIIGIGREVIAKAANGREFPIDLAVSETRLQHRRVFTGIIRDLSQRKSTEAELVKVENEAKLLRERLAHVDRIGTMGEMATGIAHEINQPLAAIANYTQACIRLINGGTKVEDITDTLTKVGDQAHRAGEVIRRLRNFIKKRESQREDANINHVIEEILPLIESDARLHDVILQLELAHNLAPVSVDSVQIQQVILNLARNGLEAMTDTPKAQRLLIIETQQLSKEQIAVCVTDCGHGIDEAASQQTFTPFFTTKSQGMGLGLAISRSIISAHGGELNFKPNQPQGTQFQFTLLSAVENTISSDEKTPSAIENNHSQETP